MNLHILYLSMQYNVLQEVFNVLTEYHFDIIIFISNKPQN